MDINRIGFNYGQQVNNNINNKVNINTEVNVKSNNYDWVNEINDVADFSLDYSKEEIASIMDDISSNFKGEFIVSSENNKISITDYVNGYGEVLNKIKGNPSLNEDEKKQLTRILDVSFDTYVQAMSKEFSNRIDTFFNSAYYQKNINLSLGRDLGITGEKLVDSEKIEANIFKMISSTKIFYKNHIDGTDDELEQFLNDNFSKTEIGESIENLSYTDFISLQNALEIYYNNFEGAKSLEDVAKAMDSASESLDVNGSSKKLAEKFENIKMINNDSNARVYLYASITDWFKTVGDKLKNEVGNYSAILANLQKQRDEMKKKHDKEIQELNEKLREQMMKMMLLNMKNGYDQKEALDKQQKSEIAILDELELKIRAKYRESKEKLDKLLKDQGDFIKKPSLLINDYLKKDSDKSKNNEMKDELIFDKIKNQLPQRNKIRDKYQINYAMNI